MFSAFLPNASSSMKLAQNGTSKPSNRFSVRVFKTQTNLPFTYSVNPKPDMGNYRQPPPQREQQNWYPPSNNYPSYDTRPRTTTNYAIYPSANDGTFIYEQSTCSKSDIFSNSELDAASTATFSPALSTDSTITLPSTNAGDRHQDDLRLSRPATPAATRSGYPTHGQSAPQAPSMNRATSTSHHAHEVPADSPEDQRRASILQARSAPPIRPTGSTIRNETMSQMPSAAPYIGHIPEYAASTVSELEVDERDRIAKINAGYNSTPSGSLYSSNSGSSNDSDRRRSTANPPNPSMLSRESFGPTASQQPLHPNLHFPSRPLDPEFAQSTFHPDTSNNPVSYSHNLPLVERIPSQLPPEYQIPPAGPQPPYHHPSLPGEPWSRDAMDDYEPARTPSQRTSPKNIPQPFEPSAAPSLRSAQSTYGASIQDIPILNEQRQDRSIASTPIEPRGRRPSIIGPRFGPDSNGVRPYSEVRDYGPPRGPSDYRQVDVSKDNAYTDRRDAPNSSPRGQPAQTSPRDNSSRGSLGAELRRETRTPLPREIEDPRSNRLSRRDSYVPESAKVSQDMGTKLQSPTDSRDIFKASSPLSSSPTQIRASLTEIEPTPSRRGPFLVPADPEPPKERTRTRSISFSSSARPTLPVQNSAYATPFPQQSQPPSRGAPEARRASDEERYGRSNERSSPSKAADPLRSSSPTQDYERRSDTRTSTSQATYYSQSSVPTAIYENQAQQRQTMSGPVLTSSRPMDRASPTVANQLPPQGRGSSPPETSASRSRVPYPEPAYSQPQPPPHTEPIRRYSDGDKPHGGNIIPRSTPPYDKQPSNYKVAGPPPNWPANVPMSGTTTSEPHRRNSDGDQNLPFKPALSGRNSAPLLRSVRWNDNLICPSPILCTARRKGWFNRRGDQLWTNNGAYMSAPAGQDYPPDLDDYPEPDEGWMNEECVRIDLNHRLIPKPPLRSALKQARN